MDTHNTEKSEVALREEAMLAFWRENNVFNTSVETPRGEAPIGDFVFYDGPPFATGLPHYGHILAGTIKDAIPRFWTMNGFRVNRTWGWDCHGLPLENIIEKRLGLATKRDIEAMGVKQFNEAARDAVLEYADDWKKIVPRMGRFVDMEDDYRTMDSTYTESVWWVFGELNKKGLVYEGFKSMHLCPRCGTTLSNFEVNQGYKDIKDIAVTVKMPLAGEPDTSILIWTTTPWTLPGNMAVAVNKEIEYVKVRVTRDGVEEVVILAKARLVQLGTDAYEIIEEMKGSDLIGKSYTPPFDAFTIQDFKDKENAWKIYHADYVEVGEEGTGVVHIAPAYGDDDMQLAKEHNVPIMHHVDTDGRFKDFVTHFAGQLVKPKDDEQADVSHLDSDIEVVKRLKDAGLLFKKENITHSYPHCWRCDTPLLNYATTSWFVRVTDIKDKLVEENAKVKWVPEHVGTNRFGKWLEGARDWAVSRQRYWGAPIPIWKNPTTGEHKVIGSLKEMQSYIPKSGNRYFLMRHGESEFNVHHILNSDISTENPLTTLGVEQVKSSAAQLSNIDLIIYSPLGRTRQTAELVAESLGIGKEAVREDVRLRELGMGGFEGKQYQEKKAAYGSEKEIFTVSKNGVETLNEVRARVGSLLDELHTTYTDKNILLVGHGDSLWMLESVVQGATTEESIAIGKQYIKNGEVRSVTYTPFPHNDTYELDYHRPYIDEITLVDEDGTPLVRVPDVFDCWFESGSMPYAQKHYPFSADNSFDPTQGKGYPAQFIAEGLDQTRGWFYSLIVLGTALFGKAPFKQVVVNGLVLAEDGKKMSKSLQNYPDPMDLANRVGVDAMRYYLLSSPAVRGEDVNFSEKEVFEVQRKNIGRLHNVLAMYEMFADSKVSANADSTHVLDRWIIARLNQAVRESTDGYTAYELDRATRPLETLIDDLSVWYLRRSRDRFKGSDEADKKLALSTLRYVLKNLALLMAPAMPFYAEYLFLRVREEGDKESVHLSSWPEVKEVDPVVLGEMSIVRELVSLALEARTKANIKVRQPLGSLSINIQIEPEYAQVICEEVNVKEVVCNASQSERAVLNTEITGELKQEGDVREYMRAIQDVRKQQGLNPHDRILLQVNEAMLERIGDFKDELMGVVGAGEVALGEHLTHKIDIEGVTYTFEVTKV